MSNAVNQAIMDAITGQQKQAANNPFTTFGGAIASQMGATNRLSGTERAILAGLAGFGGGFGQAQADKDMDLLVGRVAEAMQSPDPVAAFEADPELSKYANRLKIAQVADKQSIAAEEAKAQRELQQDYAKRGLRMAEDGSIIAVPGYAQTIAAEKGATSAASELGKLSAQSQLAPGIEAAKTTARMNAETPFKLREKAFDAALAARDPGKISGIETELRKEFNSLPEVKRFSVIDTSFGTMVNAYNDQSGASDLDFIFGVMKTLDPESVVREGEQQVPIKTGGAADQIYSVALGVMSGQKLTPEIRKNLLNVAARRYEQEQAKVNTLSAAFSRMAQERGANPKNVVLFNEKVSPFEQIKTMQDSAKNFDLSTEEGKADFREQKKQEYLQKRKAEVFGR